MQTTSLKLSLAPTTRLSAILDLYALLRLSLRQRDAIGAAMCRERIAALCLAGR